MFGNDDWAIQPYKFLNCSFLVVTFFWPGEYQVRNGFGGHQGPLKWTWNLTWNDIWDDYAPRSNYDYRTSHLCMIYQLKCVIHMSSPVESKQIAKVKPRWAQVGVVVVVVVVVVVAVVVAVVVVAVVVVIDVVVVGCCCCFGGMELYVLYIHL